MKRNKILWIVIVGLMVLEVIESTLGLTYKIIGRPSIVWVMFVSFLLPIVTCALIAITARYRILWIAAIPSVIEVVYVALVSGKLDNLILFPMPKIVSTLVIVLIAYLLVLEFKKVKNKKGEDI
ncbi:MAG: hypothetical protein FWH04_01485 [Oscillospiraceae bacterium]|nr:hypothetical protein [Oscillospiraceae bacterium]